MTTERTATLAGVKSNFDRHERLRLGPALLWLLSLILVAVAVYHVLTGIGAVGGPCN